MYVGIWTLSLVVWVCGGMLLMVLMTVVVTMVVSESHKPGVS